MEDQAPYLIEDLVIDPVRGRVSRGPAEIPLPKLSYDLLLVLTRGWPKLLSVDELATQVWPGLVISPETVSQRIKLLRDALGDDPKAPKYIAGIRGRGYQLKGPVRRESRPEPLPLAEPVPMTTAPALSRPAWPSGSDRPLGPEEPGLQPGPEQPRQRRLWIAGAGTVALLIMGIAFLLLRSRHDREVIVSAAPAFNPPKQSVVVMGFNNLTGDSKDDYFAEGMSEEVVNALTRIRELHVKMGPPPKSPQAGARDGVDVARHLNAATVLQGSVRKSGTQMRITLQLIDSRTSDHLWSQTYNREMKDALDLQSEIAQRVASTLNVTLLGDVRHNLTVGGTTNPDAFEAYLRARHGESSQDRAGLQSGLDALDEAIRLDPKYANAYAFRADLYSQLASEWASSKEERAQLMESALAAGRTAVALAPASANAHLELAMALSVAGIAFRAIDQEFRKAAELEQGNGVVQVRYAEWAAQFGRADALTAIYRGTGRNPTGVSDRNNLGVVLFYLRRHEEARPHLHAAADQSKNPVIRNWMGINELALGNPDEALKYCTDKTFNYDQVCMSIALHQVKRFHEADDMLNLMTKSQGDAGAYQYAEIYASWGDPQRSLGWLEKAVALEDSGLSQVLCDPFLDSVRSEPRFKKLVALLDLPT